MPVIPGRCHTNESNWYDGTNTRTIKIARGQEFRMEGFKFTLLPFIITFDFGLLSNVDKYIFIRSLYMLVGPIPEPNEATMSPEVIDDDVMEEMVMVHY